MAIIFGKLLFATFYVFNCLLWVTSNLPPNCNSTGFGRVQSSYEGLTILSNQLQFCLPKIGLKNWTYLDF